MSGTHKGVNDFFAPSEIIQRSFDNAGDKVKMCKAVALHCQTKGITPLTLSQKQVMQILGGVGITLSNPGKYKAFLRRVWLPSMSHADIMQRIALFMSEKPVS